MVAVAHGLGLHAGRVRARVGLGEGVREHRVALGERAQVLLLERLGAGQHDRQGAELVDRGDKRGRGAHAGDLFDDDHGGQGVRARAAELLGDVHRVQVGGDQGVERLLREAALLVHLGGERRDLGLGERAHDLAQLVVLLGRPVQVEVL
ncbi:hypothetical protein GCM10020000_49070 [Streptomyces olivoverticillatus]